MFDVDGTLVRSFMREQGGGAIQAYDVIELLPGRYDRLRSLGRDARFALVTNQGGVAFGYQDEEQVYRKLGGIAAHFDLFWGRPFSVHVCFEHPNARVEDYRQDTPRRKPKPGMLFEAMKAHFNGHTEALSALVNSVFIGDMDSDREAAHNAGVRYCDVHDFFD